MVDTIKKLGGTEPTEISCGFHAVESIIARTPELVVEVLVDGGRKDIRSTKLRQTISRQAVSIRVTDRTELDQLAGGVRHQGVVALLRRPSPKQQPTLERILDPLDHPALLLVLDGVKDPHNLGACLRSAEGAGVDAVLLPKDRACPVNQTVRRVAAGAAERINVIYVANLARTLLELKARGIWLVGCADQAEQSIYEAELSGDTALLLGAEDKGLRRLTQQHCDYLVHIPMAGEVSSLNVSVACGVTLFEAVRQRSR